MRGPHTAPGVDVARGLHLHVAKRSSDMFSPSAARRGLPGCLAPRCNLVGFWSRFSCCWAPSDYRSVLAGIRIIVYSLSLKFNQVLASEVHFLFWDRGVNV